jgi:16S rRNA (adenine(1408)-N(1))-methyltransferase
LVSLPDHPLVRILQGSKQVEAPADWRASLKGRRVIFDVGAGDGRWAYESARSMPEATFIAIDPDAESLATYAYRASRKPARGGIENVLFVVAAVESLPPELSGVADVVRVNFPWGSLLRGLVLPETPVLVALRGLGKPDARFEFVTCYDPERDTAVLGGADLPSLSLQRIDAVLAPVYERAGLSIEERRQMSLDEAIELPSSWARRLLHGRPRDVFWIAGRFRVEASLTLAPSASR